MPPIAGAGMPMPGAMDSLAAGGSSPASSGAEQQRAQVQAFMGQLRDLDKQASDVLGQYPNLQPIANQVKQLLKKAAQEAAKLVSGQSASADALPGGGQ